ncbi:hypothetical protein [Nitrosomonas sp.]|uniref:hypothetical protein n=1 Tax=Nitrosomonas sp. TaxID=42353 RepID=UPI0025EC9787|nr:hypothetical protein [Nitrosomonas sp.]MBY0484359.1 hypothetical protein [Nitrosomonas sp.]
MASEEKIRIALIEELAISSVESPQSSVISSPIIGLINRRIELQAISSAVMAGKKYTTKRWY